MCSCGSGCSACRANPCSCSNLVPYYDVIPSCEEDHCKKIYVNQFSFAVCPQDSWNVPSCGQTAILSVPGVRGATVGAFLWNPTFGYYEITQINVQKGTIGVVNNCYAVNASPGTQIPKCTCFTVTDLPSDLVINDGIFVAYDFTAPDVGDCLDITLTSVDGLITGNNVQIGTGIYLLDEVKANDVVTICNEGEGIIPGTPVVAKDISGQYQYPVIQLSTNPCAQDPVEEGAVIACNDGSAKPITGPTVGHVLTLHDVATGSAGYDPIPDPDISSGVISDTSFNVIVHIPPNSSATSGNASVTIINPSTTRTENVFYTVTGYFIGNVTDAMTHAGVINNYLNIDVGGGPVVTQIQSEMQNYPADTLFQYAGSNVFTAVTTIPPSSSMTIIANLTISIGLVSPTYDVGVMSCRIDVIGVAV